MDGDRPLTRAGAAAFARAARGWRRLVPPPQVVITSPFVRARQTAELLQEAFEPRCDLRLDAALQPEGRPEGILELLPDAEDVALVGHMPLLGDFLGRLLGGSERASVAVAMGMGLWIEMHEPHAWHASLLAALDQENAARLAD
jgi:phosphohistidine phosphatase